MKSKTLHVSNETEFKDIEKTMRDFGPHLVIAVGSVNWFQGDDLKNFKQWCPKAEVIGCSSAGEIAENGVFDSSLVIGLLQFSDPQLSVVSSPIASMGESYNCGKTLGSQWDTKRLSSVFALGRGLDINGSKLIEGLQESIGKGVEISGGLAGDGGAFQETFVLHNNEVYTDRVVALGVYDESFSISNGSKGGWLPFGPIRKVTRATENVLFEIDNKPALGIYKEYLGEQAKDLPGSGLLFPLETMEHPEDENGLIRTILGIDEAAGSITLAGEVREGQLVRLMHANNEGLIAGAREASSQCLRKVVESSSDNFALLTSCVGRKLVMGEDIDDEVDAVREEMKTDNVIGFYSYGEISPHHKDGVSKLHNQTMTISYFWEKAS